MKKLFTLCCFGALAVAMSAMPAKRVFRTVTQPDGSTVEAMLVGDEHSHHYVSRDGIQMLKDAQGVLHYAGLDADNNIILSPMAAAEAAMRTPEANAFIASNSKTDVAKAFAKRNNNSRRAKKALPAAKANGEFSGLGLFSGDYPRKGQVHGLVILVEYKDVKFTVSNPSAYFNNLLNQEGFSSDGATGSVRDYFLDQSHGQFDVTFDLLGPVTLPNNRKYYGGNVGYYEEDEYPEQMLIHAMDILKSSVDFSKYDYDNDGKIDNIYLIYAGVGEASSDVAESVWPHSWEIPDSYGELMYNGKQLYGYACSNEIGPDNVPDGIGNICHEFSHVMGLPDLYDINYEVECTPGMWSVMDYGSYNNDGRTPPNMSSYERNALGWMETVELDGAASITLTPLHKDNTAYHVATSSPKEFFLIENRQNEGWDTYLPGHGMLIWHVDFVQSVWDSNEVNVNSSHQYVDLIEANNAKRYTTSSGYLDMAAMAGMPFPGTKNVTSFTASTTPAFKDWSNKAIELPLTDITENADGTVSFDVAGGFVDLATPAAPALSANAQGELTATWAAVDMATGYDLQVFTRNGEIEEIFGTYETGNVTSYTVAGIQGNTEYFARVRATRGTNVSEFSAAGSTTSPAVSFEYSAPMALQSFMSNGNSLLTWKALEGATNYLLTVNTVTGSEPQQQTVNCGSGNTLTLPAGWTWSGTTSDIYKTSSTGYFGEAAPSLKFSKTGYTLASPEFSGNINKISFWTRGAGAAATNALAVEGSNNGTDWTLISEITGYDQLDGNTFTIEPQADYKRVRFVFTKVLGNVALDDIVIEYGNSIKDTPMNAVSVGNTTSYNYSVPAGVTEVSFFVTAENAQGQKSKPSNTVIVKEGQGITAIEGDSSETAAEYYTLQGIRVDKPESGLYIVKRGAVVTKEIVR